MRSSTSKHTVQLRTAVDPNEPWHFMAMDQVEVRAELFADVQSKKIGTAEEFWTRYLSEQAGDKGNGL